MVNNKIKKATVIHSIIYKTYPKKQMLQYCLSLFISGIIVLGVGITVVSMPIKNALQVIASFLIIISMYLFPYLEFDALDKFISNFTKYIGLLSLTIVFSMFWYELCSTEIDESAVLIFVIPATIIEIFLLVPFTNYTIKPIIKIISKITSEIKEGAKNKNENIYVTYFKTFSANASIIISAVLSFVTLGTTIDGIINFKGIVDFFAQFISK